MMGTRQSSPSQGAPAMTDKQRSDINKAAMRQLLNGYFSGAYLNTGSM